jgi:small conductance mechanosensitive channel
MIVQASLRAAPLLALVLGIVLGAPGALAGQDPAPDTLQADTLQGDTVPVDADALRFAQEMASETRARAAAVEELLAIYRRIPGLRDVRIVVDGGILELSGRALSARDRDEAIEYARELVPGVVFIDDAGLVVETDIRRRLSPAGERIRDKTVEFLRFLPTLLLGLAIVAGGVLAAGWVGRREWLFAHMADNVFARNLVRQVVRAVVVVAALVLALDLMGITALVGAVLGAAGVAGIAVGFAFRDIVENYLAGVLLSLRQPFAPSDLVIMAGEEGQVIRLTGRETVLMTPDGNHVRIPNATVYKAVITNLTRNPRRRFHFLAGVAPGASLGRAAGVARDAVASVPGVLTDPAPAVEVLELLDASVRLRVSGWVSQESADFQRTRSRALRAVKEAFEAAEVAIPTGRHDVRIVTSEPEAAPPPAAPDIEPADPTLDTSPDRTIDEEIARELERSDEENLLQAPGGPEDLPPSPSSAS